MAGPADQDDCPVSGDKNGNVFSAGEKTSGAFVQVAKEDKTTYRAARFCRPGSFAIISENMTTLERR